MANPFLVLGGIAISVATAAFGILQVPGWVASAQDAAAVNDLTQVSAAQNVSLSEHGTFRGSVKELNSSGSVKVSPSAGTHVYTATDGTGRNLLTVARSASGAYFARTDAVSRVGQGTAIEDAVRATGATISGPANARVTAGGVRVPAFYTNLHVNPGARSEHGFGHWAGEGNVMNVTIEQPSWPQSKSTIRATWESISDPDRGDLGVGINGLVEAGKTYTLTYKAVSNAPSAVSAPRIWVQGQQTSFVPTSSSPRVVLTPLIPAVQYATFTVGADWQSFGALTAVKSVQTLFGKRAGDYLEISDVMLYEGNYDPDRVFFSGDDAPEGYQVGWAGTPNSSTSHAFG